MPDILKKILKKILVLLLIIAASFGIELLVFNYRTFVKGEKADIFYQQGGETPENLETVEEMASSYFTKFKSSRSKYWPGSIRSVVSASCPSAYCSPLIRIITSFVI